MGQYGGDPIVTDENFERQIEELEGVIEDVQHFVLIGDFDETGRISLIFERLTLVQNAIDDWRQG